DPAPSGESTARRSRGSRRGGGWNWVGVVSGLLNPNDSGAGALERRPRHDERYHEGGGCGCEGLLFDDWFDAIEDGVRARVRGFIETMLEEELCEALSRPRYGRRKSGED